MTQYAVLIGYTMYELQSANALTFALLTKDVKDRRHRELQNNDRKIMTQKNRTVLQLCTCGCPDLVCCQRSRTVDLKVAPSGKRRRF